MKHWERFNSPKQRGEWVELQFMAKAALRRFIVSKPWGDVQAYDVGIEHRQNFLRVQVKSTTAKKSAGYLCQFKPNCKKKRDYSVDQIDIFAAGACPERSRRIIPKDAWYLIPAAVLLGERRLTMAMLCPVVAPRKKACWRYECYREAWNLLTKSRNELAQWQLGGSSKSVFLAPGAGRKPESRGDARK
ncbi:MAG TPA: group I intron-associated PD-(D/E)XK endonuclease [Candidatus Sulfotelmatobacter sp.]|nr:group I intron-associated PD-(D/E)XK endonuclease [Candidatus Sulfotelmatobacter sp.]